MAEETLIRQMITHPGASQRDEFLAACILLHFFPGVPLVRETPCQMEI